MNWNRSVSPSTVPALCGSDDAAPKLSIECARISGGGAGANEHPRLVLRRLGDVFHVQLDELATERAARRHVVDHGRASNLPDHPPVADQPIQQRVGRRCGVCGYAGVTATVTTMSTKARNISVISSSTVQVITSVVRAPEPLPAPPTNPPPIRHPDRSEAGRAAVHQPAP